jgi:hypothetical protein
MNKVEIDVNGPVFRREGARRRPTASHNPADQSFQDALRRTGAEFASLWKRGCGSVPRSATWDQAAQMPSNASQSGCLVRATLSYRCRGFCGCSLPSVCVARHTYVVTLLRKPRLARPSESSLPCFPDFANVRPIDLTLPEIRRRQVRRMKHQNLSSSKGKPRNQRWRNRTSGTITKFVGLRGRWGCTTEGQRPSKAKGLASRYGKRKRSWVTKSEFWVIVCNLRRRHEADTCAGPDHDFKCRCSPICQASPPGSPPPAQKNPE